MFVSTDGSLNLVSAAVTGLILPCYPTLVGNVILMRRSLRSEQRDHWCSTPPRLEVDDGQHGGFGAFTVKKRDARNGRNPRTGETVPVDEKVVPFFKAGKELRERVNRSDRAAGAIG